MNITVTDYSAQEFDVESYLVEFSPSETDDDESKGTIFTEGEEIQHTIHNFAVKNLHDFS